MNLSRLFQFWVVIVAGRINEYQQVIIAYKDEEIRCLREQLREATGRSLNGAIGQSGGQGLARAVVLVSCPRAAQAPPEVVAQRPQAEVRPRFPQPLAPRPLPPAA